MKKILISIVTILLFASAKSQIIYINKYVRINAGFLQVDTCLCGQWFTMSTRVYVDNKPAGGSTLTIALPLTGVSYDGSTPKIIGIDTNIIHTSAYNNGSYLTGITTLTISSPLTGISYNGVSPVSIGIDTNIIHTSAYNDGRYSTGGGSNINIGSGFRLAVPNTSNIKTLFGNNTIIVDSSSNANAITIKADSSVLVTVTRLKDTATAIRSSISGGTGTVTSVSRTNGFGINSSVATPSTTPNITIAIDSASSVLKEYIRTHGNAVTVNTYADLDTIATAQIAIVMSPVYGGTFVVDPSVTMTSTNYGVIRSGGTQKWRRVYTSGIYLEWFVTSTNGTNKIGNVTTQVQAGIDYAKSIGANVLAKGSSIFLVDSVLFNLERNFVFDANGASFVLSSSEVAAYAIKIQNCQESVFQNMTIIGTADTSGTVVAGKNRLIYVSSQSGRITIQNANLFSFTENAIVVDTTAGTAPTIEGVRILNCNFRNQPYDGASTNQYAVDFRERGEYSQVDKCISSAIVGLVRVHDGGNIDITNNIVQSTNGQTGATDRTRAIIYIDSVLSNNGGKVKILGNSINHHGKLHIPIIIRGNLNPAVENWAFADEIANNHFLSNGGNREQIYIKNQNGVRLTNNNIRAGTNAGPAVLVEGSLQTTFTANLFFDYTYGIKADSSSTIFVCGGNAFFDQTSGKVQTLNGSTMLECDTSSANFNVTNNGSTGASTYDAPTKTLNVPVYVSTPSDEGHFAFMTAQAGINTLTTQGCAANLTVTTTTAQALTTTNYLTNQPRIIYATSSTAGNSVDLRTTQGLLMRSGGFKVTMKWGIQVTGTASRGAFGISTNSGAFSNADPSSLTNFIGVGYDAGQTNFRLITNDGSGSATTTDLTASYPTNTSATDFYVLILTQAYAGSSISYDLKRYTTTGSVTNEATGSVSSDLPVNTSVMYPHFWINNGANNEVVSLTFSQVYVTTY